MSPYEFAAPEDLGASLRKLGASYAEVLDFIPNQLLPPFFVDLTDHTTGAMLQGEGPCMKKFPKSTAASVSCSARDIASIFYLCLPGYLTTKKNRIQMIGTRMPTTCR